MGSHRRTHTEHMQAASNFAQIIPAKTGEGQVECIHMPSSWISNHLERNKDFVFKQHISGKTRVGYSSKTLCNSVIPGLSTTITGPSEYRELRARHPRKSEKKQKRESEKFTSDPKKEEADAIKIDAYRHS